MIAKIISPICLFLVLSLVPTLVAAGSIEVTLTYDGPGSVDSEHQLLVFLLESMPLGGSQPLAVEAVDANGGSLTFEEVESPAVYLVALYDARGGYAGGGLPPLASPAAVYKDSAGAPRAIELGQDMVRVEFRFGDSTQLADLLPGPKIDMNKLDAAAGIIEIRMYKIKPGMRDRFVRFFEEKTLEPQAAVGMRILGQFRSLMDDDTFVWIRAFASEEERAQHTAAFYGGELWKETLGPEAISMLASTEVVLVEPTQRSPMR